MANLLDTIRQNRSQLISDAQSQTAAPAGATLQTQNLLRAKTGKAVGGGTAPAISNLGEQAAIQQAQTGITEQVAPQVELQNAQEKQQQQAQNVQQQQALAGIEQQRQGQQQQFEQQANSILNQFNRDKSTLADQKSQAQLEQAAQVLNLKDQKYIEELQNIGAKRRIDSDADFKNSIQKLSLGNNLELLQSKLGSADVLSANDRDFQKAMADLSIEDALKQAQMQIDYMQKSGSANMADFQKDADIAARTAQAEATAAGLKGLIGGGIQGYSVYKSQQPVEGEE